MPMALNRLIIAGIWMKDCDIMENGYHEEVVNGEYPISTQDYVGQEIKRDRVLLDIRGVNSSFVNRC